MCNKSDFARIIEDIGLKSILYEVSATPKPGLVDRNNNGAHNDMDYYTFLNSGIALRSTLFKCALSGTQHNTDISNLLSIIRPIGIVGEKKMFSVTNGINTHKGLIFSLGILSAAAGYLYNLDSEKNWSIDDICRTVIIMTTGIVDKELKNKVNEDDAIDLTYGEAQFNMYGLTGARGEVASGFGTARLHGVPIMKRLVAEKVLCTNDMLVQVLLNIIINIKDSNVIGRHDLETLEVLQSKTAEVMFEGGMTTSKGLEMLIGLDTWCIGRWISPGGAADMLAVTYMLFSLEYLFENKKQFENYDVI